MCTASHLNNHQLPQWFSTTGAVYLRSYYLDLCFISNVSSLDTSLAWINVGFINYLMEFESLVWAQKRLCFLGLLNLKKDSYVVNMFTFNSDESMFCYELGNFVSSFGRSIEVPVGIALYVRLQRSYRHSYRYDSLYLYYSVCSWFLETTILK